ncbi:AAA family ATPase [Azospirillum sp. sgz302134]
MDGDQIRALRETRGMTQADLAAALNGWTGRKLDKTKVSKWESGKEKIPADVAGHLLMMTLERPQDAAPARCTTVSLAIQKGGTAKTATSLCLSYVLARAGYRTLLIDGDSQANATVQAGVPVNETVELTKAGRTLYHALTNKAPVESCILRTAYPNLHLLPSSIALAVAEKEMTQDQISPSGFMRQMIAQVRDSYDFVVIDCAPALSAMTMNALVASDYVLIPCQTEAPAILGLDHLHNTLREVQQRANPRLQILGIVPTMYNARLSQDRASLEDIQQVWGPAMHVFDPIPRATIYSQAAASQRITVEAEPGAPGIETFVEIARRLIAHRLIAGAEAPPESSHAA